MLLGLECALASTCVRGIHRCAHAGVRAFVHVSREGAMFFFFLHALIVPLLAVGMEAVEVVEVKCAVDEDGSPRCTRAKAGWLFPSH